VTVNKASFWDALKSGVVTFYRSFTKDYSSVSGLQTDTPITDNDGNNTDIPDNEADVSGDNNGENVADDDIPSEESNAEDESEENTEAENSDSDENEDSGLTEDNDIETDNEVSDTSEEAQAPSSDNNSEDNSEDTPSAIDELLKMAA